MPQGRTSYVWECRRTPYIPSQDFFDRTDEMLLDMRADYELAVKKSIVDYVCLSQREKERLCIAHVPQHAFPPMKSHEIPTVPDEWHNDVLEAR